jgi:hypothetical protein
LRYILRKAEKKQESRRVEYALDMRDDGSTVSDDFLFFMQVMMMMI